MKPFMGMLLSLWLTFCLCACAASHPAGGLTDGTTENKTPSDTTAKTEAESEAADTRNGQEEGDAWSTDQKNDKETNGTMESNRLLVRIGEHSLTILLEDNAATQAIRAWLGGEEKRVSASNYGGFEKILHLGASFPTENRQTTTAYGDVMLYNGNQIVIFYEPNAWSYTRLGRVISAGDLAEILGGSETEAVISLLPGE